MDVAPSPRGRIINRRSRRLAVASRADRRPRPTGTSRLCIRLDSTALHMLNCNPFAATSDRNGVRGWLHMHRKERQASIGTARVAIESLLCRHTKCRVSGTLPVVLFLPWSKICSSQALIHFPRTSPAPWWKKEALSARRSAAGHTGNSDFAMGLSWNKFPGLSSAEILIGQRVIRSWSAVSLTIPSERKFRMVSYPSGLYVAKR